MAQRRNSKAKTFQFGTVSLNEVLNPNLQFQSLYSQNLFEKHKVIVDNLWSLKPQNFQNQNLEYAYGKTISALAQHLQNLQNQFVVLETEKFKMLKNQEKQENHIRDLETKLESLNNVSKTDFVKPGKKRSFFFLENERIGNSYPERYRQNPKSFSRPRMMKRITPLESSREILLNQMNCVEFRDCRFCTHFEMERANHGVPCGTCMGDTWHMGGPSVMPLGLHELGGGQMSSHPHA